MHRIDPGSVRLEGVAPLRSSVEDVATPRFDDEGCECTAGGPDGLLDLTLKFDTQALIAALGTVTDREERPLTLTGLLTDRTPFEARDCVWILLPGERERSRSIASPEQDRLDPFEVTTHLIRLDRATPNPLLADAIIPFRLRQSEYITLRVCDVTWRSVRALASGVWAAGEHSVRWDGRDDGGRRVARRRGSVGRRERRS